jgi:hypothetical protein
MTLDTGKQDFLERLRPFTAQGISLLPQSNRTQSADSTPSGWIAKVVILKDFRSHSLSRTISAGSDRIYASQEAADTAALWMGLRVLETTDIESIFRFQTSSKESGILARASILEELDNVVHERIAPPAPP